MRRVRRIAVAACLLAGTAFAGGPRWVTGAPYFQTGGVPVAWGTRNLQYFTDPGDLSGAVNHGAADAMVATAASAWNVAVSSMVVSRGGALAEDVSGANVYMGSNGPVFPADVLASNAAAIPVAVIYDADGAVTDTLLGGGASDPGNCRQAAVSTSVAPVAAGVVGLTASAGGGTASASFTAAVPPDTLSAVSVPANGGFVGRVAAAPFVVRVMLGDGVVGAGASVTVTVAGGTLGACGSASCVLTADANGMVSTTVTPQVVGAVGLTASAGGGTVSASFTAAAVPPDALTVVSVPASGGYVGRVASGVFGVKVMLGDGTMGAGAQVTMTAVGGTLAVCGASSCVVAADGAGMVSSAATPGVVGTVSLMATAGGGTASASFTAEALPADLLTVVSVPASGGFAGDVAGVWRVKVMLGDGVTLAAGAQVTMTASNGVLGACGEATCVVVADAGGVVASTVTAATAGVVGLRATAGGGSVTSTFTAVDHVRIATMLQPTEYVAAGAVVSWTLRVSATLDGVVVTVPVSWTGGPGMVVGDSSAASDTVVIGPLTAGAAATGQACVWAATCASFGAVVVDEGQWGIVPVSGGGQAVAVGGALDPVVARVVDGAGHGVAGAQVTVRQRVTGYVVCPPTGRCPVGPVLGTSSSVVVSDVDGLVSVAPHVVDATGETTGLVFVAGSEGYWSTEVSLVP